MISFKEIFKQIIERRRNRQSLNRWLKDEQTHLNRINFPPLTDDERQKIREVWHAWDLQDKEMESFRFYKRVNGFDPYFLPMTIYDPHIVRSLNPMSDARVLINKGYFDTLFADLQQPKLYVKRIRSNYYNGDSNLVSQEEVVTILNSKDSFIIKPSQDSHGGAGIRLIRKRQTPEALSALIDTYNGDFIVQEILKQHEDTAKFNPESLNTIRVLTLMLNGKVRILKSALRFGQKGAEVDNATSGGLMVQVKKDGSLGNFAVDPRFEKIHKTHNGVQLEGQRINGFEKILQLVKEYHPKYYPTLGIVAWDFAMDIEGNPIFIEGNTKVPGIFWMQMCAGPIFGEYTNEVINYIKEIKDEKGYNVRSF